MHDLERVGAEVIIRAICECDAVFIDEVGPMELLSERFREAVKKAVESKKPVISIVHWKAKNALIEEMRRREDAETYVVTGENRERLREIVVSKIMETLRENETK
jgi:nucleoside-triphosphatase